jgi:hypothetical protein
MASVTALAFNVCLSFMLVPHYGIEGAAAATALAMGVRAINAVPGGSQLAQPVRCLVRNAVFALHRCRLKTLHLSRWPAPC